jgi:hypothetical protein
MKKELPSNNRKNGKAGRLLSRHGARVMKILIFTLLFLAGLGLSAGAIGLLPPASRKASGSREIAAPRERVWQLITDVAAQPDWRPDVVAVEVLDATPGRERCGYWNRITRF